MEIQLFFPKEYINHKYRLIHFNFFVQYAMMAKNVSVNFVSNSPDVFVSDDELVFSCCINNQQVIFDYADHYNRNWKNNYPGVPYFKFQKTTESISDAIPLGPPIVGIKMAGVQGATMREYYDVKYNYTYTPGEAILAKQLPNGAAIDRRNKVRALLSENFKDVDLNAKADQETFWNLHKNCLVSVCVPGATNNMVDRGQMELIGLGVPTISPRLDTIFTYNETLEPDVHYIQCKDDYSDLIDKIKELKEDKLKCKEISTNAKQFFDTHYLPDKYWKWIIENIEEDNA